MDPEDTPPASVEPTAPATPTPTLPIGPSGLLNLKAPDGTPVTADPKHLDSLLADGYQLATDDDLRAQVQQDEHGDFGSQVVAGVESLARGATLGLSDYAVKVGSGIVSGIGNVLSGKGQEDGIDLYDEQAVAQTAQNIESRREANPVVAGIGEVVGAVAPALLTGGASAVAQGGIKAAVRLAPAAQLARAGTAIMETLGATQSLTKLGRVGQALAAAGAGAVEGAVDTGVRRVAQDMLDGDMDTTAERFAVEVLQSAGVSALAGGVLGGVLSPKAAKSADGLGAVDDALEAAPAGAVDDAAEALPPRPLQDVDAELQAAQERLAEADVIGEPLGVQSAQDRVDDLLTEREQVVAAATTEPTATIEARLQVDDPEEAKGLWQKLKAGVAKVKNARELDQKFADLSDSEAKALTKELNDFQRLDQNVINPRLTRNNKQKAVESLLKQQPVEWDLTKAGKVLNPLDAISRALKDLKAEQPLGAETSARMLRNITLAEQAVDGARQALSGTRVGPIAPDAKVFQGGAENVAQIFMHVDDLKSYMGKLARPKGEQVTKAEAALQRAYSRVRLTELDKDIWGEPLATFQARTNVAIKRNIDASRPLRSIFGRSDSALGEAAGEDEWFKLAEFDAKRLYSFMQSLGDGTNFQDEAAFALGLQRRLEHNRTLAEFYPVGAIELDAIAKQEAIVGKVFERMRAAKVLKAQRDAAKRAAAENKGIEQIMPLLELGASLIPGLKLAGSIGGSIVRAIAPVVTDLAEKAGKSDHKIVLASKGAFDGIVGGAKATARGVVEGAKATGRGARALTPVAGITTSTVLRAIREAQELQDEQSPRRQALEAQLRPLMDDAPDLADSIRQRALGQAQTVLSMLPAPDDSDPLRPGQPGKQTAQEQARTVAYFEVMRDPMRAFDRIAKGEASDRDIEALRTLYPKLYYRFGQQVVERARKAKKPLSIQQRQRLYRLTGQPTMAAHSPAAFGAAQAVAQAMSQPKDGPEAPPRRRPSRPVDPDALMARSDALMTED